MQASRSDWIGNQTESARASTLIFAPDYAFMRVLWSGEYLLLRLVKHLIECIKSDLIFLQKSEQLRVSVERRGTCRHISKDLPKFRRKMTIIVPKVDIYII